MDENSSKSKGAGISIAVILLAIVIGFGFVIGLTQTSGANNLNNKQSEISNYVFDENGTLMSYTGDMTELEIPATYSFSAQAEEVQMSSSSIYTLIDRANNLGIKNYSIENQTGNYEDEYGNVFYQEKYVMTYEKRKVIEGTDYTVTGIGASAFINNQKITSVVMPETIERINSSAFSGCTKLKSITLSQNLQRIENSAFFNCRMLQEVNIPNSVSYIGPQAFAECRNLKTVNIPTSLNHITNMTFSYCTSLTEITIPSNIRYIQPEAFYYCYNLRNVQFNEGLQSISSMAFYNCYNLNEITLPRTLRQISSQAFYRCDGLRTVILNSATVPNISGSSSFPSTIDSIYVLDEIYADYMNNSSWSYFWPYIRMMSELEVA